MTPKERVDYFRAVVDKTQLENRDEGLLPEKQGAWMQNLTLMVIRFPRQNSRPMHGLAMCR